MLPYIHLILYASVYYNVFTDIQCFFVLYAFTKNEIKYCMFIRVSLYLPYILLTSLTSNVSLEKHKHIFPPKDISYFKFLNSGNPGLSTQI